MPSPGRSQGQVRNQRRKPRGSRSVGSPTPSNASGRLSALIQEYREKNMESFQLSPLINRRSVLTDNTDIEDPKRQSWWKMLDENSRDIMEVLEDHKVVEPNIIEELDMEVLSQEKKNYTLDLPESSDNESINSIVLPQRKLFTQKENVPQKTNYGQLIGTRETLSKPSKSTGSDDGVTVTTNKLFQNKPRSKPIFPAGLLNVVSPNKTAGDKTLTAVVPKGQVRNIFGNREGNKRKNMFANFFVSESEDEVPEIQPKAFGFHKNSGTKKHGRQSDNVKTLVKEVLSQGSDSDSISSIVLTQKELFTGKENPPQTEKGQIDTRNISHKVQKLNAMASDKTDDVTAKELVQNKPTSKPMFPSALLTISPNKTTADKTLTMAEPKEQVRNIFGHRQGNKRKNMFANFVLSESEDEIQPNVSGLQKNSLGKRRVSSSSRGIRETSPTSSITTDMELDDWKHLPSSTMVENQLEAMMTQTPKRARLSKLSEAKESDTGSGSNVTQYTIKESSNDRFQKQNAHKTNEKFADSKILSADNEKTNISTKEKSINKTPNKSSSKNASYVRVKEQLRKNHVDNDAVNIEIIVNQQEDNHAANSAQNKSSNTQEKRNEMEIREIANKGQNVSINKSLYASKNEQKESQEIENQYEDADGQDYPNQTKELDNEDEIYNKHEQTQEIELRDESQEDKNGENNEEIHNESLEVQNQNLEENIDENEEQDHSEEIVCENEQQNETLEEENEDDNGDVEEQNDDNEETQNESLEVQNQSEQENDGSQEPDNSVEVECEDEVDESMQNEIEEEIENIQNESHEIQNDSQQEQNDSQEADNDSQDEQNDSQEADNYQDDEENDTQEEQNDGQDESENQEDDNELEVTNESQEIENESETGQENMSQEEIDDNESENQAGESDQNDNQGIESDGEATSDLDEKEPDVSHDTTGRNRKKHESPEAIRRNTTNQAHSFAVHARNTSIRKTKSLINVRPSLAPARESTGLADGTSSSVEGSGWDSHRTTRKTLRQTFGKDFTPRKSLRALVMEKSAKRQTLANDVTSGTKFPEANSTEFPEDSARHEDFVDAHQESDHEISRQTRQMTLETYLEKIQERNVEWKLKIQQSVENFMIARPKETINPFKVPANPMFPRRVRAKTTKPKAKPVKSFIPLEELPQEVIEDLKYKPPKRFQPSNAPWITKRLYKYLETKLEPKYDYKARVRAEKLAETIYHFAKALRRLKVASPDSVDVLKHEMARLNIVKTHFEFYEFFQDFMPRDIRRKVIPDVMNNIPLPRRGVFADIL